MNPLASLPPWARNLLVALVAAVLVIAGGGTLAIVGDEDGAGPKPAKPIVIVDPADPGPVIKAPAAAVEAAAEEAAEVHSQLEHEHEKGEPLTDAQIARNEKVAKRAGITGLPPTLAFGASFEQRGCRTVPIGVNFSSRPSSVTPTTIGHAHITVSQERPGWADVLGIRSFFGTLGVGASSHYVIDAEGHCAYIVPESMKAWTSGNMNPVAACQIEMIGTPDDNGWQKPAGLAKGALVLRDCSKRWHIPIQVGNTSGCSVVKAGLVDHNELECNNDHWDICRTAEKAPTGGSNPCPLVAKIVAAMKAGAPKLTAAELNVVRSARRPQGTGHSRLYWCRRVGQSLARIATGERHRRPARRAVLRRVWRGCRSNL